MSESLETAGLAEAGNRLQCHIPHRRHARLCPDELPGHRERLPLADLQGIANEAHSRVHDVGSPRHAITRQAGNSLGYCSVWVAHFLIIRLLGRLYLTA